MSTSGQSGIMLGLKAIGLQDKEHLNKALMHCDDPLKAISDFQEENSILLPTLKPALNILDLHGVKRLDFHTSIADELKEQLMKRVDELANNVIATSSTTSDEDLKKLEELLDKCYPLILMPRLTPLVLLIMKRLPKINEVYLCHMKSDEQLYALAPIEVKRQIWSLHSDMFLTELQPHFDKFIAYFNESMTSSEFVPATPSTLDTATTSVAKHFARLLRQQQQQLVDAVKLIDTCGKLYAFAQARLTLMYTRTHDWFYATLRNQLLTKLSETHPAHETLAAIATSAGDNSESVFKFAHTISQFLKERTLSTKRAKDLESIMESKKFERVINDIAFILADPFVVDALARNAISLLNKCVQNELLPRNCTELIFILRLLSLGLIAWDLIKSQINQEPKMDASLITEFLPNIAYFIADHYEKMYEDSLASLSNPVAAALPTAIPSMLISPKMLVGGGSLLPTTPSAPSSTSLSSTKITTSPPIVLKISTRKIDIVSSIKTAIGTSDLCCTVFLYQVLSCVEIGDWINLKVLLPAVRYPQQHHQFEHWFLHQFLHLLTEKSIVEQFHHDWFVSLVLDDFLLVVMQQKSAAAAATNAPPSAASNSNTFYEQLYKLIDRIYPSHLSATTFSRLVDLVKPKKTNSSSIHIMYMRLKEKLDLANSVEPGELNTV